MQKDEKIKEAVQHQFGKNAEKYVTSESHAKGADLSLLPEWLKPEKHWVMLDIATGGGHVAKAMSPYVSRIFSTDLTLPMLEAARKHVSSTCHNVSYVVADAESLPFLHDTFDAVTCRIAAHHFPNPERFVKEVARVLKPSGKFLFIDNIAPEDEELDSFYNTMEKQRDISHVRCHFISQWKKWFEENSLIEKKSQIRKKTLDFPTWVRRTALNEQQVNQVEQHILTANEDIKSYFSIVIQDSQILSFQVDEWMIVSEKKYREEGGQ